MFQSPSLRGSGRFALTLVAAALAAWRFNPLHCGAVVASPSAPCPPPFGERVSIPFIAGQWSLPKPGPRRKSRRGFQSPSLRGSGRFASAISWRTTPTFMVSIPFIAGQWSLPHGPRRTMGSIPRGVSIPFIAGQWSLRGSGSPRTRPTRTRFQSPSLRGSGRFLRGKPRRNGRGRRFQSPSLRGSGRFMRPPESGSGGRMCFNPLHCGAVVASEREDRKVGARPRRFNPLHCGAVVASPSRGRRGRAPGRGFNPLHCGAVVASVALVAGSAIAALFQSPSLRGSGRFGRARRTSAALHCFNPLHCGAVVASRRRSAQRRKPTRVSIPFIAGQWSLLEALARLRADSVQFQSPSLRGSGRFSSRLSRRRRWPSRFNPLHCGAVVASRQKIQKVQGDAEGFNPLHCGAVVASPYRDARREGVREGFNPLHCGAVVASRPVRGRPRADRRVSIPFIAGQWSLRDSPGSPSARRRRVSIPFIAGQWSLRPAATGIATHFLCFNPLHCGAVVASSASFRARSSASARFNPLHCGAVVASSVGEALPARP